MLASGQYQAYLHSSVVGGNPMELVIALYEGAIEATRQARQCLEARDIWGRSKAVSKAGNILTELIISLDDEKGGAISQNLKRLYAYMQSKLLEAHIKQSAAPLQEIERLLGTLLEAWRAVSAAETSQHGAMVRNEQPINASLLETGWNEAAEGMPYSGYFYEPMVSGTAVTL